MFSTTIDRETEREDQRFLDSLERYFFDGIPQSYSLRSKIRIKLEVRRRRRRW